MAKRAAWMPALMSHAGRALSSSISALERPLRGSLRMTAGRGGVGAGLAISLRSLRLAPRHAYRQSGRNPCNLFPVGREAELRDWRSQAEPGNEKISHQGPRPGSVGGVSLGFDCCPRK